MKNLKTKRKRNQVLPKKREALHQKQIKAKKQPQKRMKTLDCEDLIEVYRCSLNLGQNTFVTMLFICHINKFVLITNHFLGWENHWCYWFFRRAFVPDKMERFGWSRSGARQAGNWIWINIPYYITSQFKFETLVCLSSFSNYLSGQYQMPTSCYSILRRTTFMAL